MIQRRFNDEPRDRSRRNCFVAGVVVLAGIVFCVGAWIATNQRTTSAAGPDSSARVTVAPRDLTRDRVVAAFVGDAWTRGANSGGAGEDNWSALLSQNLDWQHFSFGVSNTGYVAGGDRRFGSSGRVNEVEPQQPDVVVIANGLKDLLELPTEEVVERLDQIAQNAPTAYQGYRKALPQSTIVVVGYVPPGDTNDLFVQANARLASAARSSGVLFVDPTAPGANWLAGPNAQFVDPETVDLSNGGHAYLAERLTPLFEGLGARNFPQVYTRWNSTDAPLPNPFVTVGG